MHLFSLLLKIIFYILAQIDCVHLTFGLSVGNVVDARKNKCLYFLSIN